MSVTNDDVDLAPRKSRISAKFKILLYIGTWLLALFATNPSGNYWPFIYMFPLGLAGFIRRELGNDGGWGVFIACILVYVAQAYSYFRAKTPRNVWILFGVLALLLICNVQGCRAMINTH